MQVHAAAQDVVRISRVNDNGIAVSHLAFVGEVGTSDAFPGVAAIARPENAEQVVIGRGDLQVEHVRIGWRHREHRAIELRRRRQTIR